MILERTQAAASLILRAALLLVILGWVVDVPGRLGYYYYTEQMLALAAGLAIAVTLLSLPTPGLVPRLLNLGFLVATLAAFAFVALRYPSLQLDLATAPPHAVALGLVMILGVLEAVRRKTGWFLPILLLILVLFAFAGPHLPENFRTRPVTFSRLSVYLALDTNALFSKILGIAAITVAPFIAFGVLLTAFGGSAVFSDIAARLVGHYTGGPAKVSVVGSAAFGMVSGSAVANVVAVGSVSIPMMARAGYRRPVAAAIEAVASTGGQLVPPILGASAFLMAELLEMPYRQVALAAILPALLFYGALILSVDFEARRLRIGGAHEAMEVAEALAAGPANHRWRYLLPVAALIYYLFVENRTAAYAGLMATVWLVAVHLVWPLDEILARLRQAASALIQSMGAVADIVVLAAAAGLIIGVLNLTGAAFALTLQMLKLSGGSLAILLVLVAFLSVLLGLGMPTVGVYVLLATLAAPALIELGTLPIAAHMYVLYFGMLSMITPPIAIACFAAATVANINPWRTAFAALKVGAGVYLVPVAFVTQPELLLQDGSGSTLLAVLRTGLAVALLSAASVGFVTRYLSPILRLSLAVLAGLCVLPIQALGAPLCYGGMAAAAMALAWAVFPRDRDTSLT